MVASAEHRTPGHKHRFSQGKNPERETPPLQWQRQRETKVRTLPSGHVVQERQDDEMTPKRRDEPPRVLQPEIKFAIVTQPTLLCCLLKMGVVDIRQENAFHSPAGKAKQFLRNWQMTTLDQWVLNCVKGYEIDWVTHPSQTQMPRELVFLKTEADCLSQEMESLVQKEAISEISMLTNEMSREKGFVSQLFAVPKNSVAKCPYLSVFLRKFDQESAVRKCSG